MLTTEPQTSWIRPGFDDADWATQSTPIAWPWVEPDTAQMGGSPTAMWLRHTFSISDPDSVRDLLLSIARSDGAIVYLNGREVHRAGLPDDTLLAESVAIDAVDHDWVEAPMSTLVEPSLLVAGDNVLAVVVYTASSESTGLSMDLSLTAL